MLRYIWIIGDNLITIKCFHVFSYHYRPLKTSLTRLLQRIGVLALGLVFCPIVSAATMQGDTLTIDTPISENLYVFAADEVVLTSSVDGDVFVFAPSSLVHGDISGDLFVFSAMARISGTVAGDLRMASGYAYLKDLSVEGELYSYGQDFRAETSTSVTGTQHIEASDVVYLGDSGEASLSVSSGTIRLGGAHGGDVSVRAEDITLVPETTISGDFTWMANSIQDFEKDMVQGAVKKLPFVEQTNSLTLLVVTLLSLLLFLVGAIETQWFSKCITYSDAHVRQSVLKVLFYGASVMLGSLALIFLGISFPLFLLAMGIPGLGVLLLVLTLGYVHGSLLLGKLLIRWKKPWMKWLSALVGISISVLLVVVSNVLGLLIISFLGVGSLIPQKK